MTNILELLKNEKVEWKKLGEVFDTRTGYTPSKKIKEYWKDGTVDWFTIDDIRKKGRNLKNANVKISEKGVKKELFKKNSLILSIIGTIGEYALIDTDFVINQQFMVFTLNENYIKSINMEFMKYYFSKVSEYCKNNIRQSSVPTIDTDGILRQEIPIPSLETQEKIVKILDKFTNYVMELQSELQSRTKQYTYYRDKLLSEDYLNKITKEMEEDRRLRVEKLKNICEFKRGKRLVKNELQEEGDFPVYQNSITPLGYYYEKNFDKDTTFIISAGAAGEIVYSDRDFWAADDVYVLLTREDIMSRYLYYCLMSKQYIIKSKVRKASIPRLSKDDIEKIIIPLPPLSLQNKIVKILDKFQILLVDTKGLLPEEIEQRQKQYEYYREKLLTFDEVSDRFDSIRFDSIRFDSIRFITNLYYDILQEAASIVGVDIQDKVEIINLGEISNINRGASPRPIKSFISNEIENSVPWIKIGDTKLESKYIVDTKERITKEGAKKSRVLKKGSFILSNSMSYGRPYILSIDGAIHDGWASINDFEQFLVSDYLYHYLITKRTQDYWQLKMNTASVSNLNSEIIRGLPILLPPLHVQQHVVNVLDKFDILVNDIKEGLPKEIEQRQKQYEYWRECLLNFPKQY